MQRLNLALLLILSMTVPAYADPISGTIAAVSAWYASIGIVGQALVQIGVGIALTAASYGLQLLFSSGGRRNADAVQQTRETQTAGVTVPEIDGLLEVCRTYGTTVTAGGLFFNKTVGDGTASAPNRWVMGLALSEGICDGLQSIIINGVECEFDSNLVPQTAPWNDGLAVYLAASFRNGDPDQAIDPIIAARFPDEDVEFRQRGVCTVVLDLAFGADADQHTELWGVSGVPQLQVRLRGLRVYDRSDATQDPDDPTTWTFSDNATVVIEDYLCAEIGGQLERTDISAEASLESIAIDAEFIPTLAGTEQSGRVNGLVFASEANVDVLASMAQQNRATISRSQGKFAIRSDRPAVPVATIHRGLWREQLSYRNEPETRSVIDGVVTQFYPASRYSQAAETSYPASALDDVNASRVTFKYCDSAPTAQRLGYAMVTESAIARTISGAFDLAVLVAPGKANKMLEIGDDIWFEAPAPYDAMSGIYKVDGIEINSDFSISLALSGTSEDVILGWSTALETEFVDDPA